MSIWFFDYENGNNANDGKGYWKVAFTSGGTYTIVVGNTLTGHISSATGVVDRIDVTSGTWAGGNAAGNIYIHAKTGIFQAEDLDVGATLDVCTIAADFLNSAVKDITGLTSAMIAANDECRGVMSPAPVSLANATWTNASATITLATAQTTTVDACDGATGDWVASANVTEAKELTIYKEGTGARTLTVATAFTTGIVAYKNTTTLNLSSKQKITFWIQSNTAVVANSLRVDLCTDDAGATPANSFTIPIKLEASRWYPLTYSPDAGAGNLNSAIESISISVLLDLSTTAAVILYVDNFEACTTNGLNLQSLIGKNTATETFWTLKSIKDTTVILGESQQQTANVTNYVGTSETVTTYNRETIKTTLATGSSTIIQEIQTTGSLALGVISFSGGWNPVTGTQDGETWFDGLMGWGYGISFRNRSFITLSKLGMVRYRYGFYQYNGYSNELTLSFCSSNGNNSYGFYSDYETYNTTLAFFAVQNITAGLLVSGKIRGSVTLLSNGSGLTNLYVIMSSFLYNSIFSNVTQDFNIVGNLVQIKMDSVKLLCSTEVTLASSTIDGVEITSERHDQTNGNHCGWLKFGTYIIDTVIPGGGAFSTRMIPSNATNKMELTCLVDTVASAGNRTVAVDVRESVVGDGTDYNGSRIELVAKQNVAIGIAADTVLATATVASEGAFQTISGSLTGAGLTITDDGAVEFVIRCSGTTGWINFRNVVPS